MEEWLTKTMVHLYMEYYISVKKNEESLSEIIDSDFPGHTFKWKK